MTLSYYRIIASTSYDLIILSYRHTIMYAYRVTTIAPIFENMQNVEKPLVLLCFRYKMLKNHCFYCVSAQKYT